VRVDGHMFQGLGSLGGIILGASLAGRSQDLCRSKLRGSIVLGRLWLAQELKEIVLSIGRGRFRSSGLGLLWNCSLFGWDCTHERS
jgi:hypothetical protein